MSARAWLLSLCCCLAVPIGMVRGQEQAEAPAAPTAEELSSPEKLRDYLNQAFSKVAAKLRSEPAEAEKLVAEMEQTLAGIKSDDPQVAQFVRSATLTIERARTEIELSRISLAELAEKLTANPDDRDTLRKYAQKALSELSAQTGDDPLKADESLVAIRATLEEVRKNSKEEVIATELGRIEGTLERIATRIESAKRMAALIGSDAPAIVAEAWANGEPLAEADLKGKVILLDFWAVWCGPCIATFPHLREWQEKYSDKGLAILGVTRYYGYAWNEEAGRAQKSQEEVTPEDERKMLDLFAAHHELKHRFVLQPDSELSKHFGVTGIPTAVVIDRQGKVRLIKVGSGPQNAEAIGALIEELLAQ